MLRYHEIGELHKDFHGSTNTTIDYIIKNYGEGVLEEIFKTTGQNVYKSIHEKLKNGNISELVEHLSYFYNREGAKFDLKLTTDEVVITVHECPAIAHLKKLGVPVSPFFCRSTTSLNAALCEGTPWKTETTKTGEGACVQRFYREHESK